MSTAEKISVSIVIPVYNEEEVLPRLFEELWKTLSCLGRSLR